VRGYEEGGLGSGRSDLQTTAEYRNPTGARLKPGNGFGYGAGIRINTPFFAPIRLDYARNNLGEDRVQFGFGDRVLSLSRQFEIHSKSLGET
jgi:outer membrane protein insertion porin family